MTATKNTMLDLLNNSRLGDHENYNLYLLRPDGWPWGYYGAYTDPEQVAQHYDEFVNDPEFIGIWITKESNDGTVDVTLFKWYKGVL